MTVQAAKGLSKARPFPGLRPFDARDWKFFFGRADQTAALYRLVDRNRFVAVIGSSGSGKSSLTRAGLFRILQDENKEGRPAPWIWCAMRPGDAPIKALTDTLAGLLPDNGDKDTRRDRIAHLLNGSTFSCADAISEAGVASDARFVLVVDQFEELFRYSDQRQGQEALRNARAHDVASQFVELLLEASRSRSRDIHVLITMRSDFIGECAQFTDLAEAVSSTQLLVPGLTRDQLEEIICRPVVDAGSTIDTVLVEQLLNDASGELDELPVLQHCLSRLWERAGNPSVEDTEEGDRDIAEAPEAAAVARHITATHYAQIGKISGALSRHANRILRDFPEESVAAVFRALSELKDGRAIRRALSYRHLREETGLPDDQLRSIVNRFRADDCSFLLTSPPAVPEIKEDTRIDVCHEALLRRWDKCGGKPDVVAANQKGPAIGWLERERRDGQEYQFLLSKADSQKGSAVEDIKSHRNWWKKRKPTERWSERYGGGYVAVDGMLRAGWAHHLLVRGLAGASVLAVLLLVGWQALGFYHDRNAARAQRERDQATYALVVGEILNEVLNTLNRGQLQVTAALEMESLARSRVDKLHSSEPRNEEGQAVTRSPAIIELEIRLDVIAADILYDAGRESEAFRRAHDANELARKLVQRDPTKQGLLLSSMQRVGDTLALQRKYPEARDQFQSAQSLAKSLTKGSPGCSSDLQSDLAYYQSRVGDMLIQLGNFDQAHEQYLEALKIAETCVEKAPQRWRAAVPRYMAKVADAIAGSNPRDLTESLGMFDKAIERQETLSKDKDTNNAILSNLAVSHFSKAKALLKAQHRDPAMEEFRQAIDIHKKLVDEDKANASWLLYLASEQHGLVEAYRGSNSTGMASADIPLELVSALKDELATREKLAAINPDSKNLTEDRDRVRDDLATLQK